MGEPDFPERELDKCDLQTNRGSWCTKPVLRLAGLNASEFRPFGVYEPLFEQSHRAVSVVAKYLVPPGGDLRWGYDSSLRKWVRGGQPASERDADHLDRCSDNWRQCILGSELGGAD